MEVKKAKREKLKVPIMLTGASGSGKTVSALLIAKGIIEKMFPDLSDDEQWEKIGVIDTEHKRSLLYAEATVADVYIGEFLHLDFEPPFTVDNYIKAFNLMKNSGVEVVIIDSISHAWSGEGGILEQVEVLSKGKPNMKMVAWAKVAPLEKQFMKLVTGNSVYVIATARSKQAYSMEKDEKGKTTVEKVGLKPDQKDVLEYEFAIALRMDQDHNAEATKDNSNMFNLPFSVTTEIGHKIFDWSDTGVDLEKQQEELITHVTELANKSEEHEKKFNEMHAQLNNLPLKKFKANVLERMAKVLESVVIPEPENVEVSSEQKNEEQTQLFDDKKPPIDITEDVEKK
ncbi:AAA family ATPase [Enterococcus plantarum]|uniref:AAA family ATPase n=1 Tax=Enterococcus plantarum TaxID=1077675 RepID=UPI001A8C2E6E|nr:AAA family ATPase [Enterococcus plantarum]